jgi:hypothetical protein
MPYHVLSTDIRSGESRILCSTLTRSEAEQLVREFGPRDRDLRFAIVADEEEDESDIPPRVV